uniref:Uncharacterized protein n=1 Tax=Sulfolobus islandicus rod-shaped virus 1 TaxID=157898 RepID=Q5W368_SIRV1|nr:hypothetical protein [Sulfolobus islandicus rod-shaped virus 1]
MNTQIKVESYVQEEVKVIFSEFEKFLRNKSSETKNIKYNSGFPVTSEELEDFLHEFWMIIGKYESELYENEVGNVYHAQFIVKYKKIIVSVSFYFVKEDNIYKLVQVTFDKIFFGKLYELKRQLSQKKQ